MDSILFQNKTNEQHIQGKKKGTENGTLGDSPAEEKRSGAAIAHYYLKGSICVITLEAHEGSTIDSYTLFDMDDNFIIYCVLC